MNFFSSAHLFFVLIKKKVLRIYCFHTYLFDTALKSIYNIGWDMGSSNDTAASNPFFFSL